MIDDLLGAGDFFDDDGPARPSGGVSGDVSRSASHAETRVKRLTLVCMAMWSLIMDKTHLTEADLMARVKMLDEMDGSADGQASRGVVKCGQCGRTLNSRHNKCLYCGATRPAGSAFDLV